MNFSSGRPIIRFLSVPMYEWVTHMWSPGRGCSHDCSYCYVKKNRYLPPPGKVFIPDTSFPALGSGKTIFVGHTCDLWAVDIPGEFIEQVLRHCIKYGLNNYIFQSKNPLRFKHYVNLFRDFFINIDNPMFGTTIETNRNDLINTYSSAPPPLVRAIGLHDIKAMGYKTFLTIEPIMDFDVRGMMDLIIYAKPSFINIGADSKRNNLPEPSWEKVDELISEIKSAGIEIRNKENLERLRK